MLAFSVASRLPYPVAVLYSIARAVAVLYSIAHCCCHFYCLALLNSPIAVFLLHGSLALLCCPALLPGFVVLSCCLPLLYFFVAFLGCHSSLFGSDTLFGSITLLRFPVTSSQLIFPAAWLCCPTRMPFSAV